MQGRRGSQSGFDPTDLLYLRSLRIGQHRQKTVSKVLLMLRDLTLKSVNGDRQLADHRSIRIGLLKRRLQCLLRWNDLSHQRLDCLLTGLLELLQRRDLSVGEL